MKIALISPIKWRTPPRHYGPWETVVSNIAEELVRMGHDVTLFATKDSITKSKLKWICPKPLEESPEFNQRLKTVYQFLHYSIVFENAEQFDIIHNHENCYPLAFSRLIDTPIVTTLHGSAALEPESRMMYKKYKDGYFVSISDSERKGAPELNYIATVYNGIDLKLFKFNEKPKDYLLFLGRISNDKGTHWACELAKQTKNKLIIAATIPDSEKEYFNKKVKKYIDNKQIKYIGFVGPAERNKLLQNAKALAHLINFEEPFGLTMVEAMACGTPIIGFKKGSVPEVVEDKKTGFVVENLKDAERAIKNLNMINRKKCRERVEKNFTKEIMAKKYVGVYQKVINQISLNK